MTAGTWTFPNGVRQKLLNGQFLDADTFKMALHTSSGTQPSGTTTTWAGLSTSEVGTTNTGYTAGGASVDVAFAGTTTITVSQAAACVWTAGTANLTAKWAVIYEVSGDVLCYCTLDSGGADVTATNGNTLTVGGTSATIFTMA